MNRFDFNQIGGFPLSTNILDGMQAAYSLFNALGEMAGNFAIISGCALTGNTVTDGVVYINGEILEFRGGLLGSTVIISEDQESRIFESGESKKVLYKRFATFGSSVTNYPWADFRRVFPTVQIRQFKDDVEARITALENKPSPIPIGMIAIWNKPATVPIPTGWKECTDLKGRVPVGWIEGDNDFGYVGKEAGTRTHKLTIPEMPSHSHSFVRNYGEVRGGKSDNTTAPRDGGNALQLNPTGGDMPHNNLQPYRVIRFIEFDPS